MTATTYRLVKRHRDTRGFIAIRTAFTDGDQPREDWGRDGSRLTLWLDEASAHDAADQWADYAASKGFNWTVRAEPATD